jgi:quinol monooxygenase YgiN
VYSQTENSDSLVLLEEWKSREGLEQHIRSDDFRTILAVMDLAIEPPEIKFVTASNTAGMELIEELRG